MRSFYMVAVRARPRTNQRAEQLAEACVCLMLCLFSRGAALSSHQYKNEWKYCENVYSTSN